ncbi:MAG: hypothetical protein EXR84_09845 [Gammaproteobacteria bacterium]|nr:hypothetical protein [Gammaproteobacteria bacterium]
MKLAFASAAWVDEARRVLEDLVSTRGEAGRKFSVCERFTTAPTDVAPSGTAAWHFRIDGKSVTVGAGEIGDADVQITADYRATLPAARLVYTREILAARATQRAAAPPPGIKGDMTKAPPYLVELHNRLALVTV